MPESVRSNIKQGAVAEKRVALRLRPYATFETLPRHVSKPEDTEGLTHWLRHDNAIEVVATVALRLAAAILLIVLTLGAARGEESGIPPYISPEVLNSHVIFSKACSKIIYS